MNSFELYNPTKLVFGTDSFKKISTLIPADARVLMLYGGGSIKQNGVYDAVKEQLKNFFHLEFGGIEPNPTYQTLSRALAMIKAENIDFLLAVGGGSVIDGTKWLAAAGLYAGDGWDIPKKGIRVSEALPFGTVLTLPATGSEMNSGAVITNLDTKEKLGMGSPVLFPKFSICNPEVVRSIPRNQLQNGIIDAFTHVMEQYLTYPTGAWLQDRFAESILINLIEIAPRLLNEAFDLTIAGEYMYSCTMALNGQIQKGVPTDWATHMIGHELTAHFGIDHARTLAIIMPQLYRHQFERKKAKLAHMAERVWRLPKSDTDTLAKGCIEALESFYDSIGMPHRLSDYVPQPGDIAQKVQATFEQRNWLAIGEHKSITPQDVAQIVSMSI